MFKFNRKASFQNRVFFWSGKLLFVRLRLFRKSMLFIYFLPRLFIFVENSRQRIDFLWWHYNIWTTPLRDRSHGPELRAPTAAR